MSVSFVPGQNSADGIPTKTFGAQYHLLNMQAAHSGKSEHEKATSLPQDDAIKRPSIDTY